MEISYQISWRQSSSSGRGCGSTTIANNSHLVNGGAALNCQHGCSGTIISRMSYVCACYNDGEDWSFGEHQIEHTFSATNDTVTLGTVGYAWVSPFGHWNVSTTFSLVTRVDTQTINSSPRVLSSVRLRLQEGCSYTIPLAVSDPDNDTIRCRWAVGVECESVCNSLPGAVLDSDSCTITYTANRGTGLKAVAIMVEDFAPGSNHPLSSVAFQFLVLVYSSSQPCSTQTEYPSIILHPSNETVVLQQNNESINVTLTCMANETSSYYWERQNGDIPFSSVGVHTNTLIIIDIQLEDAGNYRCVASSCDGISHTYSNYATVSVGKLLI